jgi:hypothetical protein
MMICSRLFNTHTHYIGNQLKLIKKPSEQIFKGLLLFQQESLFNDS